MAYTAAEIAARLGKKQRLALLAFTWTGDMEIEFSRGNEVMRSLAEKWLQEGVKAILVTGRAASRTLDGPETSVWSLTLLGREVKRALERINPASAIEPSE